MIQCPSILTLYLSIIYKLNSLCVFDGAVREHGVPKILLRMCAFDVSVHSLVFVEEMDPI
jgi:hypothetical protein